MPKHPEVADKNLPRMRSLLLIALTGFLSSGLILFTDYLLWDAWWMIHIIRNPAQAEWLSIAYWHGGRPLDLLYLKPFASVGDPVLWSKIVGFCAWVLTGCAAYAVFVKSRCLPEQVALYVAVLGVTMPLFDVMGDIVMVMNTVSPLLFWLGWLLFFSLSEARQRWRLLMRVVALCLFFLSFNYNSQLVYFYALGLFFALLKTEATDFGAISENISRIKRYADFVVLPVVFWIAKAVFTPTHGYSAGYNSPKITPEILVQGYGFLGQMIRDEAVSLFFNILAVLVFAISAGVFWIFARRAAFRDPFAHLAGKEWKLMLGGLMLLLAAAFPYVVVGQGFSSTGWWTRNAILLTYPLAVIMVGAMGLVLRLSRMRISWIAPCLVAGAAVLFAIQSNASILRYQAFGAKQFAAVSALRDVTKSEDINAVNLRDYFIIPDTLPYYPPSIWSFLGAEPDRPPKALIVDTTGMVPDQIDTSSSIPQKVIPLIQFDAATVEQIKVSTTMPYMFGAVKPEGRTVTVAIEPGAYGNDGLRIGLRYLWLRWFDPTALSSFVRDVAKINAVGG